MREYAFETELLAPGLTWSHMQSDLIKTNRLMVFWVGDLADDVTERALLPNLLCRGTQSFPTLQSVTHHLEMLYGTGLSADVMKIGERHVICFRLDFVNDNYLPKGDSILGPVMAFMREVLHAPALDGDRFPTDVVEQEKAAHRKHIEGLLNDKASWAHQRLVDEMCAGEAYRRHEQGDVADLESIGAAGLAQEWRDVHGASETYLYLAGDLDRDRAREAIAPLCALRSDTISSPKPLPPLVAAGEPREVVERLDVSQTHLAMGYRTGVRLGDPLNVPLAIANGVLGAFSHSKLFQNVREKASLCYTVQSHLDRSQGLLFVQAGIKAETRAAAQELIEAQLRDVQQGSITSEEFQATLAAFDNRLEMLEDNPAPLMQIDLAWRLAGADYDHRAYREALRKVTIEDVVSASQGIALDTVYVLEPESAANEGA